MFKSLAPIALAALLLNGHLALAADDTMSNDEGETIGYDAIVDQLNRQNSQQAATVRAKAASQTAASSESAFDTVWMHGGVGFANYIEDLRFDDGKTATLNQKGIQAALGVDLFSPNWMAEGTARSFGEDGDSKVRSSVHEFELKILYKDRLNGRFGYRAGAGLTGRYLTLKRYGFADQDYTTPTSVATLGGDAFITDRFSLGVDLNARNSLIGETIDHNSYDMTLRIDAHF